MKLNYLIIDSVEKWNQIAPPFGRDKQWEDGRSAKELEIVLNPHSFYGLFTYVDGIYPKNLQKPEKFFFLLPFRKNFSIENNTNILTLKTVVVCW